MQFVWRFFGRQIGMDRLQVVPAGGLFGREEPGSSILHGRIPREVGPHAAASLYFRANHPQAGGWIGCHCLRR